MFPIDTQQVFSLPNPQARTKRQEKLRNLLDLGMALFISMQSVLGIEPPRLLQRFV